MTEQRRYCVFKDRIIIKEGWWWVVRHSDGAVTKHKTHKEAQEYRHTINPNSKYVFDPVFEETVE
tara:strand:- start:271 stop:465 length:195 start_codon:yes stop_codon:yes gene_type:complete